MSEQYNITGEAAPLPPQNDEAELTQRISSGANWFYWIAGLSIVNSAISFFNGQVSFPAGLGINQVIDAFARIAIESGAGTFAGTALFVFGLVTAGIFFIFGVLANRRQLWAFIVGIVVYALDSLIYVFATDIIGLAIHALALFFLIRGFFALRQLKQTAQT